MKKISLILATLVFTNISYASQTDFQQSIPQFFRNYAYFENNFPENEETQSEYKRIVDQIIDKDLSINPFYKFILHYTSEKYVSDKNKLYDQYKRKKNQSQTCLQVMQASGDNATTIRNLSIGPVAKCIEENNLEKLSWFIAIKMPLNDINDINMRPIHHAVMNDDTRTLRMLLDADVDINAPTHNKFTPLHIASYYNKVDAMKILISKDADINAITRDHNTALHYAMRNKNLDAAKLLVAHSADITHNAHGKTPIDYASTNKMIEIFSDSQIV